MNKKMRNTVFLLMLILLAGMMFAGCGLEYVVNNSHYLRKSDAEQFRVDKEAVEPITQIDINTGMAEVELIEADNYYLEIDYLYWEEKPEYSIKNGRLFFDDSDAFPNSYSINFSLDNTIKIYLPKGTALEDLSIDNSSGDVNIESFVAEDMDVSVSYGDFTMKNAAAQWADITLSSGTSRINGFQAGELNFNNSYGNAKFTDINTGESLLPAGTEFSKIDVTMSSGDVDINGLNCKSINITNSYGDVSCEGIISEELDASLSSGYLKVEESEIKEIDAENSYGDVTLNLKGDASEYYLDLDTSYGNIKLDNKKYEEHLIIENDSDKKITASLSSGDVTVDFK